MRFAALTIAVGTALLAGCGHEPIDLDEEVGGDEEELAVTKPKEADPGSLGGICGVNFADCPTEVALREAFRNLPRTSVSFKRETKDLTKTTNLRRVILKYKVPRLVNDHKEALDAIEIVAESRWPFPPSPTAARPAETNTLVYKRNGTTVGTFIAVGDQIQRQNLDVRRGGFEAMMSFIWDINKGSLLTRFAHELVEAPPPVRPNNATLFCTGRVFEGNASSCTFCKLKKTALVAGPPLGGGLLAAFSKLKTWAQVALVGVSTAGTVAGELFVDCGKACGRAGCDESYCEGRTSAKEYDTCCRMNSGLTSAAPYGGLQCNPDTSF